MDLAEVLFLTYEEVLQFHADQLGLFGGQDGIRDDGPRGVRFTSSWRYLGG
jgi:hypothetical protein